MFPSSYTFDLYLFQTKKDKSSFYNFKFHPTIDNWVSNYYLIHWNDRERGGCQFSSIAVDWRFSELVTTRASASIRRHTANGSQRRGSF
jgi:hypothetical protein